MFCKYCGEQIEDDAVFCSACGKRQENALTVKSDITDKMNGSIDKVTSSVKKASSVATSYLEQKKAQADAELAQYDVNTNSKELKDIFVDPEEIFVAKLGNGFLVNLLVNKKLRKCAGLLTNKRAYFKGRIYATVGGKIQRCTCMQTIDVEDITGSGFLYQQMPPLFFLISIIFIIACTLGGFWIDEDPLWAIVGFIISLIPVCLAYFLSKRSYFFIEYAGGKIMFDAAIIGIEDVNDFQKQIRRVKDKVKGKL